MLRAQYQQNSEIPEHFTQSLSLFCLTPHTFTICPQVRDKMNLKVNSISAPEQSRSRERPSQNIEDLRWEDEIHKKEHQLFCTSAWSWLGVWCSIGRIFIILCLPVISVDALASSHTCVRCLMPQMRWWVTSVSSTMFTMSPWAPSRLKPWSDRCVYFCLLFVSSSNLLITFLTFTVGSLTLELVKWEKQSSYHLILLLLSLLISVSLPMFSLSQVIEELNLRVLFTLDERYMLKRSVYSKMISTINSPVNPSQYLSIAVDAEEKRQLEQELNVSKSYYVKQTFKWSNLMSEARSRCWPSLRPGLWVEVSRDWWAPKSPAEGNGRAGSPWQRAVGREEKAVWTQGQKETAGAED